MNAHQVVMSLGVVIAVIGTVSPARLAPTAEAETKLASGANAIYPAKVLPLPGALDDTLVFNSNSPEEVLNPGVLLSTLPGGGSGLGVAFNGRFSLFSHHIAKDRTPGQRLLYLGLLAHNPSGVDLRLKRLAGASYLSQPDALFKALPALVSDPEGVVFAGPGDRTTTDLLHGRSPLAPTQWRLPAHQTTLLDTFPIPTQVAIPPAVNGRSTLMHLRANGPIYLSEIACFAQPDGHGGWLAPTQADFERILASGTLVTPRDLPGSPVQATGAQMPHFRYGRVAGVSVGDRFIATLSIPDTNTTVAYPIASVALNRWGTTPIQSAPLKARYPDTAHQAHGNYGIRYDLRIPLDNRDTTPHTLRLSLTHPARIEVAQRVIFQTPPARATTFRGTLRLDWAPEGGQAQQRFAHLVLHGGEHPGPFARITVPAGAKGLARLQFIYPADATPPQLLMLENHSGYDQASSSTNKPCGLLP